MNKDLEQKLEERIQKWKQEDSYGTTKHVERGNSPFRDEEKLYKFTRTLNLSSLHVSNEIISTYTLFLTFTLSKEYSFINSDGDLYRLDILLKDLDTRFEGNVEKAITKAIEDKNPPGFF